ncbi:hypothetical protein [Azospirillum canadense]|uniref:hypothetical protein n=1 Tax=Azospirillum canadense TaxID=403962 RepID=UPI002227F536|nr:hypothetical protein [Azospirillum canadense]MCW2240345.1 hypothetical protein [Azospirillum canadense]
MPDQPLPTTLFDHLPSGAHPLLLYAAAAVTILLAVGAILLAALTLTALARRLARALHAPSAPPPGRPLLAPWERRAMAALRGRLPAAWSVHPHVNPLALLSVTPLTIATAAPATAHATAGDARTAPPLPVALRLAATRPILFTVTGPDHIPCAIVVVTAAEPTRANRRQDAALAALFRQHGIAVLFLTPGTRPDWPALATAILAAPPQTNPPATAPSPSRAALTRAAGRATGPALRVRAPGPTATHRARIRATLSIVAARVRTVVGRRLFP